MSGQRRNVLITTRMAWTALVLVWTLALSRVASAGVVVGIEFWADADHNLPTPVWDSNVHLGAYPLTTAAPFASALAGYAEVDVQNQVVAAVQEAFRSAEIHLPGRMLDVDIRWGAVSPKVGTVDVVGSGLPGWGVVGDSPSRIGTAISRPDLNESGSGYTNMLSVTLANNIANMTLPAGYSFDTVDKVVNALAGTVAHEIGHTLGVENHVPGAIVDGVYPIMASGSSSPPLPNAARLTARKFLDIPDTEPDDRSVTQVLLDAAGTTSVTDFNFDRVTDVLDYSILMANLGKHGTGVKMGDVDDDGVTDSNDYNMLMTALGPDFNPANSPEPSALVLLGTGAIGLLAYARWKQRQQTSRMTVA